MNVATALPEDLDGFLSLAAEVENWFGPMAADQQFHATVEKNIARGTALVVRADGAVLGGLLTGGRQPAYRLNWLVVAAAARSHGVGRSLVHHAINHFQRPSRVDVITFGKDHPAAVEGGARAFYERLGFAAGQEAPPGPEGGTRQWYHLTLPA
ncbi:GNAT family N-acetyltransferase [Micromonospora taraxaci]|uniref:GNAT family N-acetyltransferase n=1 Tax=Micromonospora taraxaci TaxID=1316803 RepID=UPI0033EF8F88